MEESGFPLLIRVPFLLFCSSKHWDTALDVTWMSSRREATCIGATDLVQRDRSLGPKYGRVRVCARANSHHLSEPLYMLHHMATIPSRVCRICTREVSDTAMQAICYLVNRHSTEDRHLLGSSAIECSETYKTDRRPRKRRPKANLDPSIDGLFLDTGI
ncbi:hypothetical protein EV356DRAFT_506239, partial [Viridothelium virens]